MKKVPVENTIIVTFAEGIGKYPEFFYETGLGVEISNFAYASNMDSENFDDILGMAKENLKYVRGTKSLHGPYRNMDPASPDPKIRNICFERYSKALDIAKIIGVDEIVFHANYNPLYSSPGYNRGFLKYNIEFFEKLFEEKGEDVQINLENMFEESFLQLRPLLDYFDGRIKLLIDSGHLNVFSKIPSTEWIKTGRKYLNYLHLNDNTGKLDKHNHIGSGNFEFISFFDSITDREKLKFAIEVKNFNEVKASLKYLVDNNIIEDMDFQKY